MAGVPLITQRSDDLDEVQRRVFDQVVATRGSMIRPFEVMLHAPHVAEAVAELGARLRYASSLPDDVRELLTLVVASSTGCAFVWDSHVDLARAAGVRDDVIEWVRGGAVPDTAELDELVIGAVRALCATATMSSVQFAQLRERFGDAGAVEFAATVGYYTLLCQVMGAADACD